MDDGLDGSYSCDMAVEDVKRRKAPSSQPQKDVIPSGKYPEYGQVGIADYASAVCNISPMLHRTRVAKKVVSLCVWECFVCLQLTIGWDRISHMSPHKGSG